MAADEPGDAAARSWATTRRTAYDGEEGVDWRERFRPDVVLARHRPAETERLRERAAASEVKAWGQNVDSHRGLRAGVRTADQRPVAREGGFIGTWSSRWTRKRSMNLLADLDVVRIGGAG